MANANICTVFYLKEQFECVPNILSFLVVKSIDVIEAERPNAFQLQGFRVCVFQAEGFGVVVPILGDDFSIECIEPWGIHTFVVPFHGCICNGKVVNLNLCSAASLQL